MANDSDSFTEDVDTDLAAHASANANTWTKNQGNVLTVLASGDYLYNAAPSNVSRYALGVTPATAEYSVQATITATGHGPGPCGRADFDNEYGVYFNSSTGNWVLRKIVAAVETLIATYTGDAPTTAKVVKLEILNATKKVYIDTIERISSTDNAITLALNPGLNFRGVAGEQMDDWSSTDYVAAVTIAVSDSGIGTDAGPAPFAELTLTDTGSGADALLVAVAAAISDTVTALDALSVSASIALTDSGTGVDAPTVSVNFVIADAAAGTDLLSVAALLQVIEAASGTEVVVHFDAATRIATVTFSLARRSAEFILTTRSTDFSFARRDIAFQLH